jgi:hypothetical protein
MAYLLFVLFILILTTRLISFYTGLPYISFFISIFLLFFSILEISKNQKKKINFCKLDLIFIAIICLPIYWAPYSSLINYDEILVNQFFKTLILDSTPFIAYFSTRWLPIKNPRLVFNCSMLAISISVPIIYLQQYDFLSQFYYPIDEAYKFVAVYRDQFGIEKFRNSGFYGNWHDAGVSLSLLVLAIICILCYSKLNTAKLISAIGALFATVGALFLTSARAEIILTALTISIFIPLFLIENRSSINFRLVQYFFLGLLLFISLIITLGDYLPSTIFTASNKPLSFINSEGRIDTVFNALDFLLLTEPIKMIFGWGLGAGGIAVVQGAEILPINTVDNSFIIILANYGLLGLIVKSSLLGFALYLITEKFSYSHSLYRSSIITIIRFCQLGLCYMLLSILIGEAVLNRIFICILLMNVGALTRLIERCQAS